MTEIKPDILMIEDDPEVVRLCGRMLTRRGFCTEAAGSLTEAYSLLEERSYELLILDVNLPDGSGYELCRKIRAAGQKDLPIIFLTGRGQLGDRVEGLGSGGDYYLVKPYSFDELFAVIQSLIGKTERMRKKIAEATTVTRGPLTLQIPLGKAFVGGYDAELTPKEYAVLLLLIQNEDNELSDEVIYKNVWGMPLNNNSAALRQHISRLKKKLGEGNTDEFSIFNDRGRGYIFSTK